MANTNELIAEMEKMQQKAYEMTILFEERIKEEKSKLKVTPTMHVSKNYVAKPGEYLRRCSRCDKWHITPTKLITCPTCLAHVRERRIVKKLHDMKATIPQFSFRVEFYGNREDLIGLGFDIPENGRTGKIHMDITSNGIVPHVDTSSPTKFGRQVDTSSGSDSSPTSPSKSDGKEAENYE